MIENIYPPSPKNVPKDFIQPNASYKRQVVFVLFSILLFLILYAAMVMAAAYIVYFAFSYPMGHINKLTILLKLGSIAASVMLFAFMLKFLFKRHDMDNPLYVEITEEEHPKLFAFIRQLCQETGAPFPNKIYVNHEINAAVFYNSTVLSLFLPVKKNLLIGLGLVNSVNLSEFKAVLAHEFGHFAQSSMKLGSYVYMANQIVYSMVYERDKWDEWLEEWKRADFRISVFAWILMPIVWLIRKAMNLIYQGINLVNASLSRQMEFNADRVAVSVTGSDAIINGLYKLGPASEAFSFSNSQLSTAIDHKLYTKNLFYHQTHAVAHLQKHNKDFKASLFENKFGSATGLRYLFSDEDEHLPEMYSSHPSNFKREQNAKSQYFEGVNDERSPWLLFENPETLAEKVTRNLLTVNLQLPSNTEFTDPEKVQSFVEAELTETTYDARYHGVYDNRFLTDIDLEKVEEVLTEAGVQEEHIPAILEELYGPELVAKMEALKRRQRDLETTARVLQKYDKRKEFSLTDGKTYAAGEAKQVYEQLIKEYDTDGDWYKNFDQKVFGVHYVLAAKNPVFEQEFMTRYQFHMAWQPLYRRVQQVQQTIQENVQSLVAAGEISEQQVKQYASNFQDCKKELEDVLEQADKLMMPKFTNTESVQSIGKYLLESPITEIYANSVQGDQINNLIEQTGTIIDRMRRMYFKSLGGILSLQEKMAAEVKLEKTVA